MVLEGVFDKRRFLDLIRYFIVFEDAGGGVLTKKIAGYHQFHAVNMAVAETLRAAVPADKPGWCARKGARTSSRDNAMAKPGDRRVGVVWHTQGSARA